MNIKNIKKSERYIVLGIIIDKKPKTIKQYFWRNKLLINNKEDILTYLNLCDTRSLRKQKEQNMN